MSARRRRVALALAGAALLAQTATAADAALTSPTLGPSPADLAAANKVLLQKDSSLTTYAGQAGETSDASRAPVDVTVSFP